MTSLDKKTSCILIIVLLLGSCSLFHEPKRAAKKGISPGSRIAVLGFHVALPLNQSPVPMRDPITGSVFIAEPTPKAKAAKLTDTLYKLLSLKSYYTLISQTKVFEKAFDLSPDADRFLQDCIEVGKSLGADLVIVGYLYRWRERKGESYGVKQAASVAFSLSLVSVSDRQVLWSGKFDKTQRSLAENLLDFMTFLRGKGKWMSAEELARVGLERVLKEIPLAKGD